MQVLAPRIQSSTSIYIFVTFRIMRSLLLVLAYIACIVLVYGDSHGQSFFMCGDGYLSTTSPAAEQCDDMNTNDGDGCSRTCKIEPFFECPGAGDACTCTSDAACNGRGTCNLDCGKCDCIDGYIGNACQYPCSTDTCWPARGQCDANTPDPGHCKCIPPYFPSDDGRCANICDSTVCNPMGGRCGGHGECMCNPGFCGPRCDQTNCGKPVCYLCGTNAELFEDPPNHLPSTFSAALNHCNPDWDIHLMCTPAHGFMFEDSFLSVVNRDIYIGVPPYRHTSRTYVIRDYMLAINSRVRFNGITFAEPPPSLATFLIARQFMVDNTSIVTFGSGTRPADPPIPTPFNPGSPNDMGGGFSPIRRPASILSSSSSSSFFSLANSQRPHVVTILQAPNMCSLRLSETSVDEFHQIIVSMQTDVANPGSLGTNQLAGIIHNGDATNIEVQCVTDRLAMLGMPVAFWGPGGGSGYNSSAINNIHPILTSANLYTNPGTYTPPLLNETIVNLSGALIMGYPGLVSPAVAIQFPGQGNFTCHNAVFIDIPGTAVHVANVSSASVHNTTFIAVGSLRNAMHIVGAAHAQGPFVISDNANTDALQPTTNNTAAFVLELDGTPASAVTIVKNRMVNDSFDHGLVLLGYPEPPMALECPFATLDGKGDERCFAVANPRLNGRVADVARTLISAPAPADFCIDQCPYTGPMPNTTYTYITVYTTEIEDRDVTLYVVAGIAGMWVLMWCSIVARYQWRRSVIDTIARNALATEPKRSTRVESDNNDNDIGATIPMISFG